MLYGTVAIILKEPVVKVSGVGTGTAGPEITAIGTGAGLGTCASKTPLVPSNQLPPSENKLFRKW